MWTTPTTRPKKSLSKGEKVLQNLKLYISQKPPPDDIGEITPLDYKL